MNYVKAPEPIIFKDDNPRVFLAGGITRCKDWQTRITELLKDQPLNLINPRRDDFDVNDKTMSEVQIEWEYAALTVESDAVLFWFSSETVQPITLYELGRATQMEDVLFVGCHKDYPRRFDVIKQLSLARPEIQVVDSLEELAVLVIKDLGET